MPGFFIVGQVYQELTAGAMPTLAVGMWETIAKVMPTASVGMAPTFP
jgi:hypothetical protein